MIRTIAKPKVRVATHEEIAARAYELFRARGGEPGHEIDDWLQAEYELMQLPIRKIAELRPLPSPRNRPTHKSIVNLVQTALVAGGVEVVRWLR